MAQMTLDDLVAQLRTAFGSGLRAVVLYGSAAAGEHIQKRSDYNVLVIVDALDLGLLRNAAAVARAWAEAGNPPPLTFTEREWRSSADIFPMEHADVLERHRVLFGTPPFDGMTVNKRDLRLQLEHEAMGKLLQLRRGIMAAHGEPKRLVELLAASLSTFMIIFRALLRMYGEVPPTDYEALTRQVAARTGMQPEPFVRVVHHVRGQEKVTEQEVLTVLAGYLAGAEQLVVAIDGLAGV